MSSEPIEFILFKSGFTNHFKQTTKRNAFCSMCEDVIDGIYYTRNTIRFCKFCAEKVALKEHQENKKT